MQIHKRDRKPKQGVIHQTLSTARIPNYRTNLEMVTHINIWQHFTLQTQTAQTVVNNTVTSRIFQRYRDLRSTTSDYNPHTH